MFKLTLAIILWQWHCGARNDSDVMPIVYIVHTSKSDKQVSVSSLFCFSWHWQLFSDADTGSDALSPTHASSIDGNIVPIIYIGHTLKLDMSSIESILYH